MKRIAILGSENYKSLSLIPEWLNKAKERYGNEGIVLMYLKKSSSATNSKMSSIIEEWSSTNKIKREMFLDNSNQQMTSTSYTTDRRHQFIRNMKKQQNKNNQSVASSSSNNVTLERSKKLLQEADIALTFFDEECESTEVLLNYAKKIDKKSIIVFDDGFWKQW